MMRRPVRILMLAGMVLAAIALAIIAFQYGQHAQCDYYRGRGGPQWAIDKYCGPQH